MDVDGFIRRHDGTWSRLEELLRRGERSLEHLDPGELDELTTLYLSVSSHVSTARTVYDHDALVSRLSQVVARAHALLYGSRPRTWSRLRGAVTDTFPAAVWHLRLPILLSAVVFVAAFLPTMLWVGSSDAALEAAAPREMREAYLAEDFEAYYSSAPAGQFAATVFVNNARVGVTAFTAGILLAAPTALVLAFNGAQVGLAAGLFQAAGEAGRFWGLVLPHGLLELTAVFVAGGTGFRLGWTVIAPGDRRRRDALAAEGRRAIVVVVGLVVVFLLAGLLEAFVTPSGLPTWARVGVGAGVAGSAVLGVAVRGREAAARGLNGRLGEEALGP